MKKRLAKGNNAPFIRKTSKAVVLDSITKQYTPSKEISVFRYFIKKNETNADVDADVFDKMKTLGIQRNMT